MNVAARVDRIQHDRSWVSIPIAVGKRFGEHRGGRLSAAIAYYTFFSLFPLLLVFVSVLELLLESRPDLRADLVDSMLGRLPLVGSRIDAPDGSIDGRIAPALIGLLVSLWAGLGATTALTSALSTVWDVRPDSRPNFLMARVYGLATLVSIGALVAVSTVVGSATAILGGSTLTTTISLTAHLGVDIGGLLLVYAVLTRSGDPWRSHLPGAVIGGACIFGLQQLGGLIVRRYIENSSDTYGTLAVVIGLLAWLHLVAQVVVIAAEINAVVARRLYPRSLDDAVVSDADRRAMLLNIERMRFDEQLSPVVSVPPDATTDW